MRTLWALIIGAAVIVVVALVLNMIHTDIYAITPGEAKPVGPLIVVTGLDSERNADKIMLTDVFLQPLTALEWVTMQFNSHVEFVHQNQLVPPNVPASQLDAQGFVDMANSKIDAQVSALSALGWKIPATPAGATIYAVANSSPAAAAHLDVGDRVVGVGSSPVTDNCSLERLVDTTAPGTHLTLQVRPATISNSGVVVLGKVRAVGITTAPVATSFTSNCPGPAFTITSRIGTMSIDAVDYTIPGHIAISTPDIGGPSAGLAMTLALVDRLSSGSLTGHLPIAATGTIDANGNVGDVGGVAEKTVAVEDAGAKVFFVPSSELTVARNASNGHLKVIAVSTLAQALAALRHLGGTPPTPLTKPYPLKAAT